MPAGNGMGPDNQGPMTGRGMGPCNPANSDPNNVNQGWWPVGRGFRFGGFGRGRGGGFRRSGFFPRASSAVGIEDIDSLKARANALEESLNILKKTIEEMEKE